MFLKNRSLRTILLVLAGIALVAAVPGKGRSDDKPMGDKPMKADAAGAKDGDKPMGVAMPAGILKKYTGFTRPGRPSDRLGPDNKILEAGFREGPPEDSFGASIYFSVYENQGEKAKDGD